MDTVADSFLKKSGANSVSIAIVKNKKTYIKHYGELDKGKGNKATNQNRNDVTSFIHGCEDVIGKRIFFGVTVFETCRVAHDEFPDDKTNSNCNWYYKG